MTTMDDSNKKSVGTTVPVSDHIELPSWLSCPEPKPPRLSKEGLALEHTQFDLVFNTVIENMCEGYTLTAALQEYPYGIRRGRFRQWVNKDPTRKQILKDAEEMLGECLFDDFVELNSKAGGELMDLEAFKVKSQNLKWLLGIYNKKRFGDTKQIEISGNVSITEALADAQNRVIAGTVTDVIDVSEAPLRLENNDGDE